jgi:hypothetical protein
MKLLWSRKDKFLTAMDDGGHVTTIGCWSKVRNELNGLRPRNPLHPGTTDVYLATGDIPAMPRIFPIGEWTITGFKEHPDPTEDHGYLYPVFIATDAFNQVPEYELDKNGFYLRPTGGVIIDRDLGLHFSTSDYTDGCLRIATEAEERWLWLNCNIGDKLVVTE